MQKSEIEFLEHINKECLSLIRESAKLTDDEFYENEVMQKAF